MIETEPTPDIYYCISDELFRRYGGIELIDSYSVFQAFSDEWKTIEGDIIRIAEEGKKICREIEPNMVLAKNSDKKYELVQKGIKGKILPVEMIQKTFFKSEIEELDALNSLVSELESDISSLWEEIEEETRAKLSKTDDDTNSTMDPKKIDSAVKAIIDEITVPEEKILNDYLDIRGKADKLKFIKDHPDILWDKMKPGKDMTYGAATIKAYIDAAKLESDMDTDSDNGRILAIKRKTAEKAAAGKAAKDAAKELEEKAVDRMSKLTDAEIDELLAEKWIFPVIISIEGELNTELTKLVNGMGSLWKQYGTPLPDVQKDIIETEKSLSEMLVDLTGNAEQMEAISLFRKELFSDEEGS